MLPTRRAARRAAQAVLRKTPDGGWCEKRPVHPRRHGYAVRVALTRDLPLTERPQGVLWGTRDRLTTLAGGHIGERRSPVSAPDRPLTGSPEIFGITLPGMPLGSPGMSGLEAGPSTIRAMPRNPAAEPTAHAVAWRRWTPRTVDRVKVRTMRDTTGEGVVRRAGCFAPRSSSLDSLPSSRTHSGKRR